MRSVPIPVAETTWILVVNGERITHGTASPGQSRELAAGLLVADGFIAASDDLLDLTVREESLATVLEARVPDSRFAAGLQELRHRRANGCGVLHWVACENGGLAVPGVAVVPEDDALAGWLRELFDACSQSHPGGGVHAAAIVRSSGDAFTAVDVSRHAAVEKVVGAATLAGLDEPAGLVLTARISGRIALTAARGGCGWIASRSVPTTLAVAIGSAAGVTMVARAGSREVHTFAPSGNGES